MIARTAKMFLSLLLLAPLLCGCGEKKTATTDFSTPQAAAASLISAIVHRDADAVRACYSADADRAYVDALVAQLQASAKLRAAVNKAINSEAARSVEGEDRDQGETMRALKEAEAKPVDGAADVVVLTPKAGASVKLKKESGGWKVISSPADASDETVRAAADRLLALASSLNELARQVESGELKEIKQIRQQQSEALMASLK